MQIQYLGHSAFIIKGENTTLVTDPYHDMDDLKFPKVEADIVTISHDHAAHNNAQGVMSRKIKFVVNGPGEYEIRGVNIFGVATPNNTVYLIEMDDMSLCHLGALSKQLTSQQVSELNGVDILFIPVGSNESLVAKIAIEVINQIEPALVIPMHYNKETLDKFTQELGIETIRYEKVLTIKISNLPQELEVVILS